MNTGVVWLILFMHTHIIIYLHHPLPSIAPKLSPKLAQKGPIVGGAIMGGASLHMENDKKFSGYNFF